MLRYFAAPVGAYVSFRVFCPVSHSLLSSYIQNKLGMSNITKEEVVSKGIDALSKGTQVAGKEKEKERQGYTEE